MCETFYDFAEIPAGKSSDESNPLDVYTFQTIFQKGTRTDGCLISIDLESAQLTMCFDFLDDQILMIEAQVTAAKGALPRLTSLFLKDLRDEIEEHVKQFDELPHIRKQIEAYVERLPRLLERCRNRSPDQPECQDAVSTFNREVQLIPAA